MMSLDGPSTRKNNSVFLLIYRKKYSAIIFCTGICIHSVFIGLVKEHCPDVFSLQCPVLAKGMLPTLQLFLNWQLPCSLSRVFILFGYGFSN